MSQRACARGIWMEPWHTVNASIPDEKEVILKYSFIRGIFSFLKNNEVYISGITKACLSLLIHNFNWYWIFSGGHWDLGSFKKSLRDSLDMKMLLQCSGRFSFLEIFTKFSQWKRTLFKHFEVCHLPDENCWLFVSFEMTWDPSKIEYKIIKKSWI